MGQVKLTLPAARRTERDGLRWTVGLGRRQGHRPELLSDSPERVNGTTLKIVAVGNGTRLRSGDP